MRSGCLNLAKDYFPGVRIVRVDVDPDDGGEKKPLLWICVVADSPGCALLDATAGIELDRKLGPKFRVPDFRKIISLNSGTHHII